MRIHYTIMATVLLLALSGVARAGTLYTPSAFPEAGTTIGCSAVNVSKKTVDVAIEVLDASGNINANWTVAVSPGQMVSKNGDGAARYCKFTFKGSKKKIRASACVHDLPDGGCKALVPAY